MERTKKKGRHRKRLRDEVEDGLNITGMNKRAGDGQRPSGIEEDAIGRQDP